MRWPTEVIVSYSGDAQDNMTVSLKFLHYGNPEHKYASTVRLLNDVKTQPRWQDAVCALEAVVDSGLIHDMEDDDAAVLALWNALVPIR